MGQQVQFAGRPVDLVCRRTAGRSISRTCITLVVDAAGWWIRQTLAFPGDGMVRVAVSPDGSHIYATGAGNELYEWAVASNNLVSFVRTIALPGGSYPCGLAIAGDGSAAYVCLSISNTLAVVNLSSGSVVRQQINASGAPWDVVLSPDGNATRFRTGDGRFPSPAT